MKRKPASFRAGFLTQGEFGRLYEAYRGGDKNARDRILKSHEALVRGIARRYCGQGWSMDDLMQEGRIGLYYALQRFDPLRNARLTTYAPYWIAHYIMMLIQNLPGRYLYRVPGDKLKRYGRINRLRKRMLRLYGREPTEEELIAFVAAERARDPKGIVEDYHRDGRSPACLDAPVRSDRGSMGTRGDRVAHKGLNPEDALVHARTSQEGERLRQKVLAEIYQLPERESLILVKRYGLVNGTSRSLKEMSGDYGVSRERVRQLELRAKMYLASRLCVNNIVPNECSVKQVSEILEAMALFVSVTPESEIDQTVCLGYRARGRSQKGIPVAA